MVDVVALALTWGAIGLVAWRVRKLEKRGATVRALLERKAAKRPAPPAPPPNKSGTRAALHKRTWGDPPPLPAEALREENLHPLPPVPTEQTYRARTRVWRP